VNLEKLLRVFEILAIETALACANGVVSQAARSLEMNHSTLWMKIKRYEIDVEDFRDEMLSNYHGVFSGKTRGLSIHPGSVLRHDMIKAAMDTLEKNDWNRTHASAELGISVRTMRNLINEATMLGMCIQVSRRGRK